jgi:hypothetical protein
MFLARLYPKLRVGFLYTVKILAFWQKVFPFLTMIAAIKASLRARKHPRANALTCKSLIFTTSLWFLAKCSSAYHDDARY